MRLQVRTSRLSQLLSIVTAVLCLALIAAVHMPVGFKWLAAAVAITLGCLAVRGESTRHRPELFLYAERQLWSDTVGDGYDHRLQVEHYWDLSPLLICLRLSDSHTGNKFWMRVWRDASQAHTWRHLRRTLSTLNSVPE